MALAGINREHIYGYLRWNSTNEEAHSAVAEKKQSNKTELDVGGWFVLDLVSLTCCVVIIVKRILWHLLTK